MSLKSFLEYMGFYGLERLVEQIEVNKQIEKNATPQEKRAIRLINGYSEWIFNARRKETMHGVNLPPSTPRPPFRATREELEAFVPKRSDYSHEYLIMKDFLENHLQYKTRAAKRIRIFYDL